MTSHGIKGSDVYITTSSDLLDLFVMLNRSLSLDYINEQLKKVFANGSLDDKVDAFVLAYQTRDIRGGKGERDLFYHMFTVLLSLHKKATLATLSLIPTYGCWRDVFKLLHLAEQDFMSLVTDQLRTDMATPEDKSISLLAKHAPREHNKTKPLASSIAIAVFPFDPRANERYRKMLSALNKRLNTVEVAMCARQFASIEPSKVPGRALKLYTKAFLNQPVTSIYGRKTVTTDTDRIIAAEHFTEHFALASKGHAKVNGAHTVYPHELVSRVLKCAYETQADMDAIEAQWLAILQPIKESGTLANTLAMCDFSGSMLGDPLHVSMALGLIIASCNTGVFKNHILTFDSVPTLHKFKGTTLIDRVNEVRHLAQGLSTDFQAAYNLVLHTLKKHAVPVGQEPTDLIVLTDMGWDEACSYGQQSSYTDNTYSEAVKTEPIETHPQIARRAFKLASEQLFGSNSGWQVPRIIIWNLRAEFKDFHASALETGIAQVSGWSPSMLKIITTRGADGLTSQAMLRTLLDDDRYDPVRKALQYWFL